MAEPQRSPVADEELLRAAAKGDAQAWATLFERHRAALYNFLLRLLGDAETAEDLVQETFLKALRKQRSFRGASRFATWLFAIGLNAARSWGRRQAVAQRVPPARTGRHEPAPPEVAAQRERAEKIRQAIQLLPEEQREVLILSRYHDFSHQEIAEVLGCSSAAVRGRLFRAMETLRQQLREELAP